MSNYNENNKPYYIRPLLNEYDDIQFVSCGALQGSWIKLKFDGGESVKIERSIINDITISGDYKGEIQTHVSPSEYDNIKMRDTLIGAKIMEKLSDYNSGSEAFEENFG